MVNPYGCGVRPVFNLESKVMYASESGSQSDPIIINWVTIGLEKNNKTWAK